ncbi:hypothetical protein [uncultured Deinococcus sp.]|uniref:hypothetical protein n=1 Tax=uncultured Deinococcus sp. TaxID=158789 RepID=UPI003749D0A6
MSALTLLLEGGVALSGTPTSADPEQVSLLAQASEVDGVMLRDVTIHVGAREQTLPWLYVPYWRVLACGVAEAQGEQDAQEQLSAVIQGVRKGQYGSRGAGEGLRALEGE